MQTQVTTASLLFLILEGPFAELFIQKVYSQSIYNRKDFKWTILSIGWELFIVLEA